MLKNLFYVKLQKSKFFEMLDQFSCFPCEQDLKLREAPQLHKQDLKNPKQLTTVSSSTKNNTVSYLTLPHSYTPIPASSTNGNLIWFSDFRNLRFPQNLSNRHLHRKHSLAFEVHNLDRDLSREIHNFSFPRLRGPWVWGQGFLYSFPERKLQPMVSQIRC